MYFYRWSFGEYEQYSEYTYIHEKKFSEEEFKKMIYSDKRLEDYGFKELVIDVWFHN